MAPRSAKNTLRHNEVGRTTPKSLPARVDQGKSIFKDHASPRGVVYVGHMTRVVVYTSGPFETASETTDKLPQACCDSCPTVRALQKIRRQGIYRNIGLVFSLYYR
ncbi:hypothetical protein FOTG_11285 [Fusarium oxysporum f. sp. vasinfectum 25433]|uniref:Uncharacterized protein n=1 Tax=Fusarium oxysporum f. sp. vasinfectum 25433 TaxID=1089449 RepID=X0L503_FUSOX|nr:hypothetical protein FOTG_11285 [Fusarium oxysporum f. sp. vasinfectum 25433]